VVFDNNYRPRLWASVEAARAAYRTVLAEVDIALLTEDDERALFGYADSEQVFAAYPAIEEVVLKRGADACLIRCKGERFAVPAIKVEQVVDTTEFVQQKIVIPAREIAAVMAGVKKGLEVLFAPSPRQLNQAYGEEEMFIG
jgi:hypothetical protein